MASHRFYFKVLTVRHKGIVEEESLQVVLSLHNLQNIWFASISYVSHGKSFSQVCTNFCFDEDLHVDVLPPAESSLALFRPLVVLFDNRNALISMTITRGL